MYSMVIIRLVASREEGRKGGRKEGRKDTTLTHV
jgi:hypothetical protein